MIDNKRTVEYTVTDKKKMLNKNKNKKKKKKTIIGA